MSRMGSTMEGLWVAEWRNIGERLLDALDEYLPVDSASNSLAEHNIRMAMRDLRDAIDDVEEGEAA